MRSLRSGARGWGQWLSTQAGVPCHSCSQNHISALGLLPLRTSSRPPSSTPHLSTRFFPFSTATSPVSINTEPKTSAAATARPLHFVFIEGEAATGKSTLCQILKSRGYTVQFEGFVELCKENSRYSPQGSIVSIKWVVSQFNAFERFAALHGKGAGNSPSNSPSKPAISNTVQQQQLEPPSTPEGFKGGVVFFDRSLLTPYVYARHGLRNEYVLDAMREIRQAFPCTTLLCKTDVSNIISRLRQRYSQGDDQAKGIRASLGELDEDFVRYIHERYLQLEREGWFDEALDTSVSESQAVDNLLDKLRSRKVLAD